MDKIKIPVKKPRARQLYLVLANRPGGKMRGPKDYNRQQEKLAARQTPKDDS